MTVINLVQIIKSSSRVNNLFGNDFKTFGSPVGAVGLALRAVNEVKLARSGPVSAWMGDTADCLKWTLVVG